MSNLYDTLCVVRTSMLNVIGQMYLDGKMKNLGAILGAIGDEINDHVDFVEELMNMSEEELFDLGFSYLNEEGFLMLIPAWLFPFVPMGTELIDLDDNSFILDDDAGISLYSDSWVNAGITILGQDPSNQK